MLLPLREYFANGFEAYFYHKDIYLKKVSPILYGKLEELEEENIYELEIEQENDNKLRVFGFHRETKEGNG